MSDEQTCGKGLAEHATLPAAMAEVASAMAAVLEEHRKSLDLGDDAGKGEDAAYETLARDFRELGDALSATAERMAGYRELPMARHDESALAGEENVQAYERFLEAERALRQLLPGPTGYQPVVVPG